MKALESLAVIVMFCAVCVFGYVLVASPEATARYEAYAAAKTAIRQAEEQTKQVQAQEWGDTMRVWGAWGLAGAMAVGGLGVVGWTVNRWQEQRTTRHGMTEKRLIITAYIAALGIDDNGQPRGVAYQLRGVDGVLLPDSNEFVPWSIARRELTQTPRRLTVDMDSAL